MKLIASWLGGKGSYQYDINTILYFQYKLSIFGYSLSVSLNNLTGLGPFSQRE